MIFSTPPFQYNFGLITFVDPRTKEKIVADVELSRPWNDWFLSTKNSIEENYDDVLPVFIPRQDQQSEIVQFLYETNKRIAELENKDIYSQQLFAAIAELEKKTDSMEEGMLKIPDLTLEVDFSSATWNTVATHELFTVTGLVHCKLLMCCTEDLAGAGNLQIGHALDTDLFQVSTAQVDFDIGELINVAGTPTLTCAPLLDGFTANGAIRDFIIYDTDIGLEITGAAATAGKIIFCLWWSAIITGSSVTFGAGGVL